MSFLIFLKKDKLIFYFTIIIIFIINQSDTKNLDYKFNLIYIPCTHKKYAAVVELVDTLALGASGVKPVRVRVSPAAPSISILFRYFFI